MAFSLSPAVTVREINLSTNIPNIPTSRIGIILGSDTGPAMKITPVTTEAELLSFFGKPTAKNYMDWFNVWNALQYTGSVYVIRPINIDVMNTGVKMTGQMAQFNYALAGLYNEDIARITFEEEEFLSDKLYFFNRFATSNHDIAIAVCSNKEYWKSPVGTEYGATVDFLGSSDVPQIDAIDGLNVRLSILNGYSIVPGTQFIDNFESVYTVKAIVNDAVAGSPFGAVLDREIKPASVSKYFGTISSVGTTTINFDGDDFRVYKNSQFTLPVTDGTDTVLKPLVVLTDAVFNGTEFVVTFSGFAVGETLDALHADLAVGTELVSNTSVYSGVLSQEYFDGTNYVIPVDTTVVKLQPGFTYEVGSIISLDAEDYYIVAIDLVNNTISLRNALPNEATSSTSTITTINRFNPMIKGINKFSEIFDESLIVRERVNALVDVNGAMELQSIVTEDLISFNKFFEYEPTWSKDEFAILVFKKDSFGKYEVVDQKICSYIPGAKDINGRNNYVDEVFLKQSNHLFVKVGPETLEKVNTAMIPVVKITGDTLTIPEELNQAQVMNAEAMFADPEEFDINILVSHQLDVNGFSEISEKRKDCVTIVAPYDYQSLIKGTASVVTQRLLEMYGTQTVSANKIFTRNGTYSAIYGNMKYQYDKFNDINRWICIAGDIAGIFAETDLTRETWWAPAGLERGKMKNVIKLAFNPNKANRDDLYVNAINPVINIVGEGAGIVFGQKTATAQPSAFDRVNVRRLLIVIEKSIATSARYSLFEFNDAFTRNRIKAMIDPYLRSVQARRGLYDFMVVCDETNNTPFVIDGNGLVIDIYVKPTKVAEFIQVNAIVVATGASFKEAIGAV